MTAEAGARMAGLEDSSMKSNGLLVVALAFLVAMPVVARADCFTPEGRDIMHIKYQQAMAAWSQNDPKGYDDAQEQIKTDNAAAQHAAADKRDQKQCAVWQRYITLSRKAAP
jgi:hypothetical protein